MPLGSRHTEEGVLLREGQRFILLRPDGGRWRLELDRFDSSLLGCRARVEGVRVGFDLLDARRIGRAV